MGSLDVVSLLTGLFGGAGATLLWETVLKPRRERRSVAQVLSAEVSLNLQLLAAALVGADAKKLPPDFRLSTMVFDAVAERIGELRPDDVGEVVFLYNHFTNLNRLVEFYVQYVDDLRACPPDAPHRGTIVSEIQSCIRAFYGSIDKAVNRTNLVQPRLLRAAKPWWSLRKWRSQQSQMLCLDEIAQRMQLSEQHRSAVMDAIHRVKNAHRGDAT